MDVMTTFSSKIQTGLRPLHCVNDIQRAPFRDCREREPFDACLKRKKMAQERDKSLELSDVHAASNERLEPMTIDSSWRYRERTSTIDVVAPHSNEHLEPMARESVLTLYAQAMMKSMQSYQLGDIKGIWLEWVHRGVTKVKMDVQLKRGKIYGTMYIPTSMNSTDEMQPFLEQIPARLRERGIACGSFVVARDEI